MRLRAPRLRRGRAREADGLRMGALTRRSVVFLAAGLLMIAPPQAHGQSSLAVGPEGGITFTPGLRVQTRYRFDDLDDNHDIYIARVRFKGGGNAFDLASYYVELKLDNVGRFDRTVNAQIENAWLNFPVRPELNVRIGLYDAVFSRDALTSDSKLLQIDRSLMKDGLTAVGLADNTVGVLVHGRPLEGKVEYSAGAFDNLAFDGITPVATTREADGVMLMGRLAWNFLDPAPSGGYADYRATYIGQGQRLTVGVSSAMLRNVQQDSVLYHMEGWGADVFLGVGPLSVQAEYARYDSDPPNDGQEQEGDGGYAQAGYLVHPRVELTTRFQQFEPNNTTPGDRQRWTSLGANIYIREHNLKVQTDFTVRS
ncbi:MAG: hypothetical protein HKN72_02030, partial [Gemmatimonadetes bacterium]|nr:hypothetical protein [Gemmatimonadota bacterium]